MNKSKSLITKILLLIAAALAVAFVTVNIIVTHIIKNEVLNQWKTVENKRLSVSTSICRTSSYTGL